MAILYLNHAPGKGEKEGDAIHRTTHDIEIRCPSLPNIGYKERARLGCNLHSQHLHELEISQMVIPQYQRF